MVIELVVVFVLLVDEVGVVVVMSDGGAILSHLNQYPISHFTYLFCQPG